MYGAHDVGVEVTDSSGPWFTKWLRSEAFWQNVVAQTVGTLFAVAIVAYIAALTGASDPSIRYRVIYGALVFSFLLLGFGVVLYTYLYAWLKGYSKRRRKVAVIISIVIVLAFAIAIEVFFGHLVRLGIAGLAGYTRPA